MIWTPPTRQQGREVELANWVKLRNGNDVVVLVNLDRATSAIAGDPGVVSLYFGETESDTAFKVAIDIDTLTLLLDAKDLTQ